MHKINGNGINEPLNILEEIVVNHTFGIIIGLFIIIVIGVLIYGLSESFIFNKMQKIVITIIVIVILGSFGSYATYLHHQVNEYHKFEDQIKEN
ncbi:hypothetical protein [Mammaliicoccus vitulinus]|uniref:hypothetical protein n=1 Tax=Mammaliicoccus vitulinus TaxID=71237 RepID=UPI00248D10E4|nr:hypothetical protein [Mammaliicoccus vitulinus]